jgi:hypothetical protein
MNRQHARRVYGPATSEHRNPQLRASRNKYTERRRRFGGYVTSPPNAEGDSVGMLLAHRTPKAIRWVCYWRPSGYDCGGVFFAYFFVKRSMRPALSISFCLPV